MRAKKVFIIEDNEDIRDIYKVRFEEAGYEVETSSNGLTGISELVETEADVIILDIMMPEMNGFEFLEAFKNNTSINAPVIVVSNLAQEEDKKDALKAGADLYLVKADYDGPDLVEKVTKFLEEFEKNN